MSKKKKDWRTEKERLLKLGLEERRKEYRGNFLCLEKIPTWRKNEKTSGKVEEEVQKGQSVSLSDKVSLHKGDITILEVDAIVNAANSTLLGGGGVDGCIHRAAGPCLYEECHTLNGCATGKAKITGAYDLPAKYVIHTVGPIARGLVGSSQREDLEACYKSSLQLVKENGLRSVAFPCISTGIYGFPNEPAAEIALRTVKSWVRRNKEEVDRVIFCVFLETDYKIYKEKMAEFFSQDNDVDDEDGSDTQGDEDDAERAEEGPVTADADMLSQKEEEDDDEEQEEIREESGDVEMASQTQDEDEAALKDPAEPSPETEKDKEREKEKEREREKESDREEDTAAASEESTAGAGGGAGAAERKTEGEQEEERGGSGEPAADLATERESSTGQPEEKSPGVPEDKLGKGFLDGSITKVRAPLAEEEDVMDVEDAEQGEPSTSKDSDTSTTEAQGEDAQEPELTQTDSNQSKDDAMEQKKDPRKE